MTAQVDAVVARSTVAYWQELVAAHPKARVRLVKGRPWTRPAPAATAARLTRCAALRDHLEADEFIAAYGSACPSAWQRAKVEDQVFAEIVETVPDRLQVYDGFFDRTGTNIKGFARRAEPGRGSSAETSPRRRGDFRGDGSPRRDAERARRRRGQRAPSDRQRLRALQVDDEDGLELDARRRRLLPEKITKYSPNRPRLGRDGDALALPGIGRCGRRRRRPANRSLHGRGGAHADRARGRRVRLGGQDGQVRRSPRHADPGLLEGAERSVPVVANRVDVAPRLRAVLPVAGGHVGVRAPALGLAPRPRERRRRPRGRPRRPRRRRLRPPRPLEPRGGGPLVRRPSGIVGPGFASTFDGKSAKTIDFVARRGFVAGAATFRSATRPACAF